MVRSAFAADRWAVDRWAAKKVEKASRRHKVGYAELLNN